MEGKMDDSVTSRECLIQVAKTINKKPEDVEKFIVM